MRLLLVLLFLVSCGKGDKVEVEQESCVVHAYTLSDDGRDKVYINHRSYSEEELEAIRNACDVVVHDFHSSDLDGWEHVDQD